VTRGANEYILTLPVIGDPKMIVLILMVATWCFMVVSLMSRRSQRGAPPTLVSGPQLHCEAWGRLDELQLTRLLRKAAEKD